MHEIKPILDEAAWCLLRLMTSRVKYVRYYSPLIQSKMVGFGISCVGRWLRLQIFRSLLCVSSSPLPGLETIRGASEKATSPAQISTHKNMKLSNCACKHGYATAVLQGPDGNRQLVLTIRGVA